MMDKIRAPVAANDSNAMAARGALERLKETKLRALQFQLCPPEPQLLGVWRSEKNLELGMRGSIGSCSWSTVGALSKVVLLTSILAFSRDTANTPTMITAPGGDIHVFGADGGAAVSHQDLISWVGAASKAVSTYFGRYPVHHVEVRITTIEGRGVRNGRTFGSSVPRINISIGRDTTATDLNGDWTMVHEMVHLAFPSVPERHHWIEEGTATYVEPIARVQAGILSPSQMWSELIRDLPQGLPGPADQGLDRTHTWGRTYWGGALFCFLADLQIHQHTHNQEGLETALRGILVAGGNISEDWPLERALRVGDQATGTRVLEDLYKEMADKPVTVDLPNLWRELGIQRSPDGEASFVDDAPLAAVRRSITAGSNKRFR